MSSDTPSLSSSDLKTLRELGEWKAREATSGRNQEKIRAWYAHDQRHPQRRVMLLAEVTYLQDQRHPVMDSDLRCTDPWARRVEYDLRMRRYEIEVLQDDHVVLPTIDYTPMVHISGFGVPSGRRHESGANAVAFHYEAPLKELDDDDFARLRHRTFRWDRDAEEREHERLESVFDCLLKVRRRTAPWHLYLPLTSTALDLVGLDQFMMLMYDNPDGLHRLMAFLRDDMLALNDFLETNGIWDLNNEDDYVGAGSIGFTRALPGPDFAPGASAQARHRWAEVESQESVGLSPQQYSQFVFPYLKAVASRFGRLYYGCCEPADPVWQYIRTLPNLARVSVSPWADEQKMGQYCRESGVAYSRKPSPNILSAERFDEGELRDHLAKTVDAAAGCSLEIIQRDVYMTRNQPERFIRWVQIARDVATKHRP